jgi:hypothetical protein
MAIAGESLTLRPSTAIEDACSDVAAVKRNGGIYAVPDGRQIGHQPTDQHPDPKPDTGEARVASQLQR